MMEVSIFLIKKIINILIIGKEESNNSLHSKISIL